MRHSIRSRFLIWTMLFIAPLSAFAGWLLVEAFGDRMLRDLDQRLREEAETLSSLIGSSSDPGVINSLAGRFADERDLGPHKQVVVLRGEQLLAEAPAGASRHVTDGEPQLRVVRYQSGEGSDRLTTIIAVDADAPVRARQRLTLLVGIGIPGLLLLVAGGLWLASGRALRPLEEAAGQLGAVSGENLGVRVRVTDADEEVGRMISVLNAMLDRLESSAAELRRFTADAAHELRTPLAVLRTGLDVALGRERTAPEYRAALEDALAGTERLVQLAEDLLTLARLDARKSLTENHLLSLPEMLNELADAWLPAAQQHGVAIALAVPHDIEVHGDEGDIYRLFNNLIANALAQCSTSGGKIDIGAEKGSRWVDVTVGDNGPGLSPADAERIFDRFYRGNGARGGGTGLGLSIARTIAEAHGGQLALSNRPAGGCVARVRLPLASAAA